MTIIGRGRCAEVIEYEQGKVIKLFYSEFPESGIQEEYVNSRIASSIGVNTPQAYEVVDYGNRIGIVYEQVKGVTLLHMMRQKPWLIQKYSKTLANLHVQMHSHRISNTTRDQKMVLQNNVLGSAHLTEEEKQNIVAYMDQLPVESKLCHADFHPDNVMVTGDKGYIIDWMTGMSGHPAGDVARTLIVLECGTMPEGTKWAEKTAVNLMRTKMRSVYLKQYIHRSGLTYSEIDQWILPIAAARLVEWIPEEEKVLLIKIIRDRLQLI